MYMFVFLHKQQKIWKNIKFLLANHEIFLRMGITVPYSLFGELS